LLADKLKDAVNVILKNVQDYQLAIAICRVYEGKIVFFSRNIKTNLTQYIGDHSPLLREILENNVIPMAIAANDRWLISMAFWLLEKQKEAVRAMVVPLSQFTDKDIDTTDRDSAAVVRDPNAFILFNHLKKQLRQDQSSVVPYEIEYKFSLFVSRSYERLGCPLLALYILTKYYMKPPNAIKPAVDEKPSLDKAEDLFGDSPKIAPAYATDLFSDEPPAKPSHASDLFADDTDLFAEPNKPSYASNLFDDDDDDLFSSTKPASSSGLFDDEPADLFSTALSEEDADSEINDDISDKEYDGLDAYKALLVVRMLQVNLYSIINKKVSS
jgi:hypothetical protein